MKDLGESCDIKLSVGSITLRLLCWRNWTNLGADRFEVFFLHKQLDILRFK